MMPVISIQIEVNGEWHDFEVTPQTFLLEILREKLNLTGCKNGCGVGQCGACTVIVEGEAVRACIYKAQRADQKHVLTIEGLERGGELHPLQRAFIDVGAVQCGYCTPGMIMASKALLDRNPDPSDDEIKQALKNNFCRCTGYVKIIKAIHTAAAELHGAGPLCKEERNNQAKKVGGGLQVVGKSLPRKESYARVTGREQYTADMARPEMLHAVALRSAYPHARVLRVDVSRAQALPGVAAVLTAKDVPGMKNHGMVIKDWPVLVYDRARYVGDAIAIVAAQTQAQAEAALKMIEVEYDPLPVMDSPEAAMAPGAERLHQDGNILMHIQFSKGNLAAGFTQADFVLENTYSTPFSEHAFLETESSLAEPDPETGGVIVYVGSQVPFEDREQIAACLALDLNQVRVIHMPTGGAFGGKEDICCQIHAALLAQVTGRPVLMALSRTESIRVHPKRHATTIQMKTGYTREGKIIAQQVRIVGDTGAYASLGQPVMTRAATHSLGPYVVPNVSVECYAVYTNNPPAGAYRGFGATQAHFAAETQMDLIAEALGISSFEIRRRNGLRVGESTTTGQVLIDSVGLQDCLDKVEEYVNAAQSRPTEKLPPHLRRAWGIAAAYKNVGLGNGLPDTSEAVVEVHANGHVLVRAGAAEVGQGHDEVLRQITAEVFGLSADDVDVLLGDTGLTPDSGPTTASRHTFVTGNAARGAALQVRTRLAELAAACLHCPAEQIQFKDGVLFQNGRENGQGELPFTDVVELAFKQGISLTADYLYTPPRTVALGEMGDNHFSFGFGAQAAQVEVNLQTGQVRVLEVVAAHDVGQAINPLAVEGQIEGGIMMGIGYALTEHFVLEKGYICSDTLAKYKIPDIFQTPRIKTIIVEHPSLEGPFGAKGVGEITSMPTAPAITNAIRKAMGLKTFSLPVDAEKIMEIGRQELKK